MADETPLVRERDWQGFKYFDCLLPLLRGLPEVGTAGPPSDGVLRIATNLLEPPAEVIADIFRHRAG